VHKDSGRQAIEATTVNNEKMLFHDIENKPHELTFVAKNDGTSNPGYTDKWAKDGASNKALGGMTVKDIQTVGGGKVDIKKLNELNISRTKSSDIY